jgi:lipopolysaccharide export system protein LptA
VSRLALLLALLLLALPLLVGLPAMPTGAQSTKDMLDSDQPIEINADSLEVQQNQRLAVFRGNVDATQGRIKLRADELRVHYADAEQGAAGVSGSIRRIDAVGNVLIWSPTETAQGDLGVYEVARKVITLTGQVVLTRGQNVLRGQRLVMNTATGVSTIDAGGGRVKGLFVPPKDEKKQ